MKNTGLWSAFILLSSVVTVSNYYLYHELRRIDGSSTASSTPVIVPCINSASSVILSEEDIVAIVDERLVSVKKQKARERLANLQREYSLASVDNLDNRLIYGKNNARITLQGFSDIECPYCRKMHADLKQVIDHSEGVINWEFKHFPLAGHNPVAAVEAQAIECIKESYGNRVAWIAIEQFIAETEGNGKGMKNMTAVLRANGLNGSLINNCLASNDHKDTINNNYEEGRNAGVTATPAVLIVDNKTGKEYLLKGYKTSEMILQAIHKIVQ
ncbi:MAG: disulfide bond formation protein DsbA [Thiotrichaceae bacterium]|nr:MAG: disulfide bond formation protein DsbA [Thiotrichaceae bacterium]